MSHEPDFTIRFSTDAEAIETLDGSPRPEGPVMLAEQDGAPVAAVGIADGHAVADRTRTTPSLLALLRLRRLEARLIAAVWGV